MVPKQEKAGEDIVSCCCIQMFCLLLFTLKMERIQYSKMEIEQFSIGKICLI